MNGLKTVILLGALTGLVMGAGYYFGGENGLMFAFLFTILMNVGSYWFSDKIVLRMYGANVVTAEEQPALHRIVDDLVQRANMMKPRIAIVNMPVPNAFATGRNQKHAVVAVTPSIMQALSEPELRAVIAHELGHVLNRDILVSSVAATLAGVISYLAQFVLFFGGGRDRNGGNLIGLLMFAILTPLMATIIQLAISRTREFGADDKGAQISGSPQDLASALAKLDRIAHQMPLKGQPKHEATAHLFIVNPFKGGLIQRVFSTHPPMEERIARLEDMRGR
ncbi:M48 family metalloprotease [Candidatus Uhrbacteria bacterium]|nr:M48 family metalloprotease [Candidatus Uhrbacteria bacterium]MBD3284433.1 M48 family metalloprotease [Candidatus Uhrbacteria bacterium]